MQKKGVLLDTNLLILLVVGLVDTKLISTHKKLRIYSEDDFKLLVGILDTSSKLVATPHILAETSNLAIHGMYNELEAKTFLVLKGITSSDKFEEVHELIKTITNHDGYLKFGVSDIGLLEALSNGYVLLTDDWKLSGYAEQKGYDVLNYKTIQYQIAEYL
ncbi:hypothetical protein [Acinetobacter sp. YH01018]|nr:hypothetical protein [Acinetobacter sp. YH01018]